MNREIKNQYKKVFGQIFKDLLIEKKIPQYQIAKEIGVKQSSISEWSSGSSCPHPKHILSICSYFGLELSYFKPPIELVVECKNLSQELGLDLDLDDIQPSFFSLPVVDEEKDKDDVEISMAISIFKPYLGNQSVANLCKKLLHMVKSKSLNQREADVFSRMLDSIS